MVDGAAEEAALDRKPDLDVLAGHHRLGTGICRRRLALRLGGQQVLCVGVLGVGEDLPGRPGFDDLALGHHADAVGDLSHDAEVMGDEQHRHAFAAFQAGEQFEDLRLHGDVERRRRLVGDQEFRLVGQSHGDHDALALAAGELVRIGIEPLLRIADADLVEQFQRAGTRLPVAEALMQLQHLDDLLLDRVQRMVILLPRTPRKVFSLAPSRSAPWNRIFPEGWLAAG